MATLRFTLPLVGSLVLGCAQVHAPPRVAEAQTVVVRPPAARSGSQASASTAPRPCPAAPTLEGLCREWLSEFDDVACGPMDCRAELLAESHGIRVHALVVEESPCDEDCDAELGVLGRPLEVPNECGAPSSHWAEATRLVVETSGWYWPAVTKRSFGIVWVEQTQQVKDIVIPDAQHVVWSERQHDVSLIEPDGGTGGRIEQTFESRHTVWLSPSGPMTRHVAALVDEVVDGTYAAALEGETDEHLRERTLALEEAQREAAELRRRANATPEPVPPVHELPPCGAEKPCPPVCTRPPPRAND